MRRRRKGELLWSFVWYFLFMAFVVTCNFILFFRFSNLGQADIRRAASVTFGNVVFMALLVTLVDIVRRYFTVTRPMRRIRAGIDRVIEGDFRTRIEYFRGEDSPNVYDEIIRGLNRMTEELGGVETLRTDFIANVSHELKTPLAVIQNYSTLLTSPEITREEQGEYAAKIAEQTRRLSSLVTNILKLNKLENQQIFPNMQKLNLTESVCGSMIGFEEAWEAKKLSIETDFDDDLTVEADPELLELVWNNLISNAIKFTEPGGTITLKTAMEGKLACASVTDTGCGIDAKTGQNIFKKFYQGDTSHAAQGNGLGLAMVRRVIDILGGDIQVSSKVGEGSTFTVKFPVK